MAYLLILPVVLGFVVFYLYPALRSIGYSFTDYNLLSEPNWVGADNYAQMLQDPQFWNALVVTLEYVVINIGVQTVVAVVLAVLMHRLTKSIRVRGIVLMPYLVANVIVALVWYWMLDYQIGIVNVALDALGIDRQAFFGSSALAIPTIAFVNVWRHAGYTALLVFAGLQSIPVDVYEAAEIDGAGPIRTFRSVTLPLLRPVLALVLVVTVVGSFQVFDTIAVTTQGGPVHATQVIYYYIWEMAFERSKFGYASAMSVFLFVVLVAVAAFQLKLMRANESDLA
ncbi:carbohydrate ABC transporter permease [Microbacterium sp.]|uniref:carbohydrate ABC transporter permease n=1 Tax=Microbacterium sp. TaxID=51671 RepID=UPI0039E3E5BD